MAVVRTRSEVDLPTTDLLGSRFHTPDYGQAVARIMTWARAAESRMVCASNAHSVVTALDDGVFRGVLNNSDLNVPDGVPVVWALRSLGAPGASRVYGPELTLRTLETAASEGVPVALYGSTSETLSRLGDRLPARIPGLKIVEAISPPFRPLTPEEDDDATARLRASGARIVLVGLGCPKQEVWCRDHRGRVDAVLMAVGAAFDFHAGTLAQAPTWMQRVGLEWLFRLAVEPRRLWRRYTSVVPRFAFRYVTSFVMSRVRRSPGKQ